MGILLLKSLLYGVLEGVTEWLPVSSTGHLILLESFLTPDVGTDVHPQFSGEFRELFLVVIQLGAVLAVVTLYFRRLFPPGKARQAQKAALGLYGRVAVGCIPAGIAGVLLDGVIERLTGRDVDGWLYRSPVVAAMLILYGALFILAELLQKGKQPIYTETERIPYATALLVGVFQMLSLVPGTSRSGATILGGMLLGLSRTAAAELSFFMAVPVMLGASGIKVLGFARFMAQNGLAMPRDATVLLLVAGAVAYLTSCLAVRFLISFTSRHGFVPFGIYRILLGAVVIALYLF